MAGHLFGLETELQRACLKERPSSKERREEAKVNSDETRGPTDRSQTPPGGYRRFYTHVRFGGDLEGPEGVERTFQKSINRMAKASLGVLPSAPVAFLQAEGRSLPAWARLEKRQAAVATRLASAPCAPT